MELTIAAAAVAVAVVLAIIVLRRGGGHSETQNLRNDLNLLRQSSEKSIQNISSMFGSQLQAMNANLQTALSGVTAEVGARLDAVNQHVSARLNENVVAVQASSKDVNDRILSVQSTFAGLQKQVGEITEQARQLGEVSRSISALERVLSAPKLRGGFGETQLENLLAEVFPRDQYCIQKRVIPVSPNSLYAYLQTIMVGLNSLRISQRAEAVLREIESLTIELEKFDKVFSTLGGHLRNASRSYEDSARELGKLEDRVESLSNGGVEQKEL